MNTPLRDELKGLDLEFLHGVPVHLTDKMADQILNLIASKMPEKKFIPNNPLGLPAREYENNTAYNQAITEVKSILKGGTDEH